MRNGRDLVFVVNYGKNSGFTLISATKKYYPILAFSNTGHFVTDYTNDNLDVVITNYLDEIELNLEQPIDSLLQYKSEWAFYENEDSSYFKIATRDGGIGELNQVVYQMMTQWTLEGKTWYPITQQPSNMPNSDYLIFYNEAQYDSNPDYDFTLYAFITEKPIIYSGQTYGPFFTTKWHQGPPFADSLSNTPPGCCAVAVGQVMHYYQSPSSFYWADMPDSTATNTTRDFLNQLKYCYSIFGTSSAIYFKPQLILDYYGYDSSLISHDLSRCSTSLLSGKPVIMQGNEPNDLSSGHFWIACGLKNLDSISYQYELWYLSVDCAVSFEYEQGDSMTTTPSSPPQYYYMNWGWNNDMDGWYIRDEAKGYTYFRHDVVDISPD